MRAMGGSGALALVAACVLACGPSVGAQDGSGGDATSSSADESGGASITTSGAATTMAADTSGDASTGASTDSSSTGASLDCEANDPVLGCPDGCVDAWAYPAMDDAVNLGLGTWMCVANGDALPDGYRSTWWSDRDGVLRFLVSGTNCGVPIATRPSEWTECSGSADDPPACASACVQDVCPGEADAAALQSCAVATPCAPGQALDCVLGALQQGTPGRYEIVEGFDYLSYEPTNWVFVVDDARGVQVTNDAGYSNACSSPTTGLWQPVQSCTLGDPQFFADCLEGIPPCDNLDMNFDDFLDAALLACTVTPTSCP